MELFKPGDKVAIKYSGRRGQVTAANETTVKIEDHYGRVYFLKPGDVRRVADES